jgi:hypothetical protein
VAFRGIQAFIQETKAKKNRNRHSSKHRDSGLVIGDTNRRIVGMLTSGAGQTDFTDVTYIIS